MNLYLIRHGQTVGNLEGRYTGSYEDELSPQGISEIKKTRGIIKNICFDRVFSSERKRAVDSARLLAGGEIILDRRLNERDFGVFENKTYKEICDKYPGEKETWERDWVDYRIPDGESAREAYERTAEFMRMLEKESSGNCLAVTHGGTIRLIFCYILGGDMNNLWRFTSKNGSISIVKYQYNNWHIDSIIQLDTMGDE